MRVTIVVEAIDSSGGFRVIATLGQLLIARGHEVRVLARQPRSAGLLRKIKAWLKNEPITETPKPNLDFGALPIDQVDHVGPLRSDDLPDADIVIGTWWKTMEFVKHLPTGKGTKIHLVQDYEVWPPNNEAEVDRVLATAGPKIAISGYLFRLLTEEFHNDDVHLLTNGIDSAVFFAPSRSKNTNITVGFTYHYDPRKGSDLIVKAAMKARETVPGLRVLAFGHTGPQGLIAVPEWVEFHVLPTPEQIRSIYAQCDAWLFGSRREGFGLPILEAMACRTPVIGMPAGAAPDLLNDGAGILLDDQDWKAMAAAIERVSQMSDIEWQTMSDIAYRRSQENQWDAVGDRLERILVDLRQSDVGNI